MASMRKSLSASATSAVKLLKSSCRAPVAGGSVGPHCTVSETCGPKVNSSTCRKASSPNATVPSPFCYRSNIPGSIPGRRSYALQMARLPGEVSTIQSLLPYYSAIADSLLVSRLGTSGESSILQGDEDGT